MESLRAHFFPPLTPRIFLSFFFFFAVSYSSHTLQESFEFVMCIDKDAHSPALNTDFVPSDWVNLYTASHSMRMVIGMSLLPYELSTAIGEASEKYAACGCNASISQRHESRDLIPCLQHPAFILILIPFSYLHYLPLLTVFIHLSSWNGLGVLLFR